MGGSGQIQFRQAKPADAEDVLSIKQAAIESTEGTYSSEQIAAWKPDSDALTVFEEAMKDDQFIVLIAEDDKPRGYAVLNIEDARVDAVYVHPDAAGNGLGASLLRQLETRAEMYGLEELTVVSSLNAQGFYESVGFEPVEERTRTIEDVDLEFVAARKELD